MRPPRTRLTYANVVATIALFLALGGSAYAVSKINGASLVNRSVAGKKIKADTLTGREIRESTLGACPAGTRIFTGATAWTGVGGVSTRSSVSVAVWVVAKSRLHAVAANIAGSGVRFK